MVFMPTVAFVAENIVLHSDVRCLGLSDVTRWLDRNCSEDCKHHIILGQSYGVMPLWLAVSLNYSDIGGLSVVIQPHFCVLRKLHVSFINGAFVALIQKGYSKLNLQSNLTA
jgi:hypothetical protein